MPYLRCRGLAVLALLGMCGSAGSQERCPEFSQLKADAEQAFKKASEPVVPDRCAAYIHYSAAWAEVKIYAHGHHDLCDISTAALSDIDKWHRRAVLEREDACGGHRDLPIQRGRYPFPPEIRPHL